MTERSEPDEIDQTTAAAPGRFAPDADAPDDEPLTDDDALTVEGA